MHYIPFSVHIYERFSSATSEVATLVKVKTRGALIGVSNSLLQGSERITYSRELLWWEPEFIFGWGRMLVPQEPFSGSRSTRLEKIVEQSWTSCCWLSPHLLELRRIMERRVMKKGQRWAHGAGHTNVMSRTATNSYAWALFVKSPACHLKSCISYRKFRYTEPKYRTEISNRNIEPNIEPKKVR